jgi:acetyl-CoA/propionyl-CoA carboxylase biotin carboxyl carrier protein
VRLDSGVQTGSVVGGNFDSLLAKLIVVGETRQQALQRAARALDEMQVDGMATALPFHRAVVRDPAFTDEPFTVHTRWIETEFDNTIPPYAQPAAPAETQPRQTIVVEVAGTRLEVTLPDGLGTPPATTARRSAPKRRTGAGHAAPTGATLASPMQGTVVKLAVTDGDLVAEGDLILVLEAMKMEQPITAHRAGPVTGLSATVGATLTAGAAICDIAD